MNSGKSKTERTTGAQRIAEILIPDGASRNGRPTAIETAQGRKTRAGIARLIDREAGTRDLLAALRLCEKALRDHCQYGDEQDLENKAHAAAKAAIAKVTGEML